MEQRELLKTRLEEWARWVTKDYSTIGYPPFSVEWRLYIMGGFMSSSNGPKYPAANLNAEEIESLLKQMSKEKPACARVIRTKYLANSLATTGRLARRLGMPPRTFERHLSNGEEWLMSKLFYFKLAA